MIDIKHLTTSEIRTCIQYEHRPDDIAIPTTKKLMLERWIEVRNRPSLTDEDFLILFCNTSDEVIKILLEELKTSNDIVDGDDNLVDINEETNGVKLDATAI